MRYTGIVVAGLFGSAMALPAQLSAWDSNPGGVEESPIAVPSQQLNQYGGYGLGPYLAGVPGVNPYPYSPSRTPSSMVTVTPTFTPMSSPTEGPTTTTDVAAEVQSSLSELEASKSSSESAASLSSSYSASAAAWTSAYDIMHIGRRDDESQYAEETPIPAPSQHLNQYGGYGLGPYIAGAPGVNPYSQTPSYTPSRTPSSLVTVTVTVPPTSALMPSPTEAPTTTTDVAAEVQSSLSELEASKSSSESAASLSSSYSASAAAWTSAYDIMHIGRRDDESQPSEEFVQGDNDNGPAVSAATPTPESLAAQ